MRSAWFVIAFLTILAPASSSSFAQAPPKPGPEFDILKGRASSKLPADERFDLVCNRRRRHGYA